MREWHRGGSWRGFRVVAVVLLLATVPVATAVGAPAADSGSSTPRTAAVGASGAVVGTDGTRSVASPGDVDQPGITVTQRVALTPDRPGSLTVTFGFDLPSNVVRFTVRELTRSEVTVLSTSGFASENGDFVWDQETTTPTITARVPVRDGDAEVPMDSATVDAGSWAMAERFYTEARWHYREGTSNPTYTGRVEPTGAGTGGDDMVFLGAHEVTERVVDGQTIRLVVPAATDDVDEAAVLSRLAEARRQLGTDGAPETVHAVALPGSVETAGAGYALGNAFYVAEDGRDGDAATWVHEYVHTEQRFSDDVAWFSEGSAEYYASLFAYYDGRRSFATFHRGTETAADAEVSVAEVSTDAVYTKGQRVAAALDQRVRAATDGERSLRAVIERLNAKEGTVTTDDVEAAAEAVAGTSLDSFFERYVRGTAAPELPDSESSYRPVTATTDRITTREFEPRRTFRDGPRRRFPHFDSPSPRPTTRP
ncbi:MAG: hypothetical protein ABEJ79_04455 [Halolamina sp.]